MASALDVPAHPLGKFHPAGSATGTVDAFWKGSPKDVEVAFALDVSPPARRRCWRTADDGSNPGEVSRRDAIELELAQFNLSTPASRVQAAGTLAASSTIHFSVSTSNLEEWRPLVAALGGPTNVPFRVEGNATFNGVASGTFSSPTLAGTLVAQDFEFTLPATSRTPEQQVHWDSLAASIQFSSHECCSSRRESASWGYQRRLRRERHPAKRSVHREQPLHSARESAQCGRGLDGGTGRP